MSRAGSGCVLTGLKTLQNSAQIAEWHNLSRTSGLPVHASINNCFRGNFRNQFFDCVEGIEEIRSNSGTGLAFDHNDAVGGLEQQIALQSPAVPKKERLERRPWLKRNFNASATTIFSNNAPRRGWVAIWSVCSMPMR